MSQYILLLLRNDGWEATCRNRESLLPSISLHIPYIDKW
jgi:hypothetical protein